MAQQLRDYLQSNTHDWTSWRAMFKAECPAARGTYDSILPPGTKKENESRIYWRQIDGQMKWKYRLGRKIKSDLRDIVKIEDS